MATRTIVTSQPDVACDVCERRLLRGEQPDIFIAAGRRRIVCELCAPRAAHEGWQRESQAQSLTLPPLRTRRGRSLFDKLRQVARPAPAADELTVPEPAAAAVPLDDREQPYDFLDGFAPASGEPQAPAPEALGEPGALGAPAAEREDPFAFDELGFASGAAAADPDLQLALEIFNASEFPRRVAGVARSLGAPAVNVRASEHVDGAVAIVVAWELCWYRYEVNLLDESAPAQVIAQGTELSELAAAEQIANAGADDFGALALAGA